METWKLLADLWVNVAWTLVVIGVLARCLYEGYHMDDRRGRR